MARIKITNMPKFIKLIVVVVGVVVITGWLLWGGTTIRKSGELTIAPGEAASHVWKNLVEGGFTSSTIPWRFYAWRHQAAAALQAGKYHIEQGETITQVIARFKSGDVVPDELGVTFPEGFTLVQMAQRTAAKGLGTVEEYVAAATPQNFRDQHTFLQNLPASRSLEGYLFPDTYQVFDDDSARDVIARQLATFDAKFTEELRAEAAAAGRSLDQIVIMASIIEREVLTDEDMALAAGILWKRFDDGTGLGADATVRYVLEKWDGALTVQDLAYDSPYNTRRYRGLPPGPISNPGLRALVAAVRPEESEYYYYLSAPDGKTYFARTNEEHSANKAKYLQ